MRKFAVTRRTVLNRVTMSVDTFVERVTKTVYAKSLNVLKKDKDTKLPYLKAGCSFDIETTRVSKKAYMYCWQFGIGRNIIVGRTWGEFERLILALAKWLDDNHVALLCYVANLGHEFQFIRKRFAWDSVFATKQRKPLYIRFRNIEIRDALFLSGGGGLATLAKNFTKTQKTHDLDYNKARNSMTPLKPMELIYTINDVQILIEFGEVCFEKFPYKIPYTQTGIIRNAIKTAANEDSTKYKETKKMIKDCFPKTKQLYDWMMLWLFRGGDTHANVYFGGETVENVWGVDFVSSYPGVMLTEKYPRRFRNARIKTDGRYITEPNFLDSAWYFVAEFTNIRRKTLHSLESRHKVMKYSDDARWDNGRLMQASYIKVALTELDYDSYTKMYDWDKINISPFTCAVSTKDYLPDYLLTPMMEAYMAKNDLKKAGMDGTFDYMNAKAKVNCTYGCCVQRLNDICFTTDIDGEWFESSTGGDYYAEKYKQVLLPQWGIWITAYARHKLVTAITMIDYDMFHNSVLYYDTDSIYMLDTPETRAAIDKFNSVYFSKTTKLPPVFHNIGTFEPISKEPCTFKTLGAKRYVKWYGDHLDVTVAGLPFGAYERSIGTEEKETEDSIRVPVDRDKTKFVWVSKEKFFDSFAIDLLLQVEVSGKKTAHYNDEQHADYVTDEYGNTERMEELSSQAIVPIPFGFNPTMLNMYLEIVEEVRAESRGRKL